MDDTEVLGNTSRGGRPILFIDEDVGSAPAKLALFSSGISAKSPEVSAKSSSVASPEQIASFCLVSSGRGVPLLSPLQSRNSPASQAD